MNLHEIQEQLKVHKGQTNDFGGYKYRSCEDIVEALKPIIHPLGISLILSDDMVDVGGRVYVKATATLKGEGFLESATGWAREALTKKGMDDAQITGSASSYARKYALNGLLAIDDTKDADTMDNRPVDYEQGLRDCRNAGDLKTWWESVPKSEQKKWADKKDIRKGELS